MLENTFWLSFYERLRTFYMSSVFIFLPWSPIIPGKCFILASWYNTPFLPKLFPISHLNSFKTIYYFLLWTWKPPPSPHRFWQLAHYERDMGNKADARGMTWRPFTYKKREKKLTEAKTRHVQRTHELVLQGGPGFSLPPTEEMVYTEVEEQQTIFRAFHLEQLPFIQQRAPAWAFYCVRDCVHGFFRCQVGASSSKFGVYCDPHSWLGPSSPVPTMATRTASLPTILSSILGLFVFSPEQNSMWTSLKDKNVTIPPPPRPPPQSFLICRLRCSLWHRWRLFQSPVWPISSPFPYLIGACPLILSTTAAVQSRSLYENLGGKSLLLVTSSWIWM